MTLYRNNYHMLKEKHRGESILIIDENKQEYFKDIEKLREHVRSSDINTQSILIELLT